MIRLKAFAVFAALVAAIGIDARTARAEFFEYSSTVTISNVTSPIPNTLVNGPPGPLGNNTSTVTDPTVGDSINFLGRARIPRPDGFQHFDATFPPGTDITLMRISLTNLSSALTTTFEFDYQLTLTVTDYNFPVANAVTNPPIGTGSIVVAGHLRGAYDASQQNTTVFTMVPQAPGGFFVAGDTLYQVFSLAFVPPTDQDPGVIGAHINAVNIPEPASMTLLGIGALGMCRMIRRRNKGTVNA